MDFDWTQGEVSAWQTIATISVTVIAIGLVIRSLIKFWPWLRGLIRLVDSLSGLAAFMERTEETLAEQNTKIESIHHEVNYNNGGSVKDSIHRVELGVKGLYERMDESDQKLDDHVSESVGWKSRLDGIDERTQPGLPKEIEK